MIKTTEITDLEMKIRERIIDEISTTSGKQKTYGQIQYETEKKSHKQDPAKTASEMQSILTYLLRQQLVTGLLLRSRYCSGHSINSSEQHKSLVKELIFWWGGTEMDLKNKQKLKYRLKYNIFYVEGF